jgi:DNA-binding ferritin-like protein
MNLTDKLTQTYCDNFVAYYRAHSCHLNVEGRNFMSDHKLLGHIYEDLQSETDTLGEIIRTLREYAPMTIYDILSGASLDEDTTTGGADGMLEIVKDSLLHLVEQYQAIQELAETEEYRHISNHAQERVTALEKFIWKLHSTLES